MGRVMGFEPTTPGTTIRCSNQLSYTRRRRLHLVKRRCRVKRPGPARANLLRHWRRHCAKAGARLLLALAALSTPASAVAAENPVRASHAMIAAAHPAAAEAGARILEEGGNAIDAAIAAQMVLGLVEPQSSGVGGGGFLLYFDAARDSVESYDGRETAPAAANETQFLAADGAPRPWPEAAVGGLPVGVPGVVRMLAQAHSAHGRTPWARLFEPAATLAERGFAVSPRLARMILNSAVGGDDRSISGLDFSLPAPAEVVESRADDPAGGPGGTFSALPPGSGASDPQRSTAPHFSAESGRSR